MPRNFKIRKGELENFSVIDYQSFKHYREKSNLRNKQNTPNYVEHGKILSLFYKKIGEKIVKGTGGVFIENLGYFGAVLDPIIQIRSYCQQNKLLINKSTSGYSYCLAFIPIAKDNILREWVADGSFSTKVKKPFSEAIKAGKKYSFNFLSFYNLYSNKRYNKIV